MRDLDTGPHRRCHVCHFMHPERRMIDYQGKWFCGIIHKLKHEREQHEKARLARTDRSTRKPDNR